MHNVWIDLDGIYSCRAAMDKMNIAQAMADHFGVGVMANSSGVSICPRYSLTKTKMCTGMGETLIDYLVGFHRVSPAK